jgi:hypothetical protein
MRGSCGFLGIWHYEAKKMRLRRSRCPQFPCQAPRSRENARMPKQ